MDIEKMTLIEKLKLIDELERSVGTISVAHVEIQTAIDELKKLHPDARPPSADLIIKACAEMRDEAKLSEQAHERIYDWMQWDWPTDADWEHGPE